MKLVLDNDSLTEDFFADTRLIGIMAPVKNYYFCWLLNHLLGYSFRLDTDIDKPLRKKKRQYYFSVYSHHEDDFLKYYLFHNHCDGEYLLPEFRNIDFILLMKGDFVEPEKCNEVISDIKNITPVQMVFELNYDHIKNKQHLVF